MSKEEEYEYRGVTFLSYQSGNEPTDRMLKLLTLFVKEMEEERIRVYINIQTGKPTNPPGCPPGQPNCQ